MKSQSIIVDKKEKGLVYYCYNILTKKTQTTLSRRINSFSYLNIGFAGLEFS